MVVEYGRTCKPGSLPVFSVGTEKEARELLVAACGTNLDGEFIAKELTHNQTIENLEAFSTRLDEVHDIISKRGRCSCK